MINSFANILKKLRKENNLTQYALGKKLKYCRSTISNYEQNTRLPSADVLIEIANYFDVSLDYLLGRSNIRISAEDYFSKNTPNILLFIDPNNGKIIDHSPAALTFYGYSRKELLNKTIFDINTLPKYKLLNIMKEAIKKDNQMFYFKHKIANGKIKDIKTTTTNLLFNDKIILVSSVQDITNLKIGKSTTPVSSLINALATTPEFYNPYKKNHSQNVANLACEIGKKLSLPIKELQTLKIASLLHDIGELKVPNDILNKPGKLTKNEYNLIKDHPKFGFNMIDKINFEQPIAKIILQEHERIDGSGYPHGLIKNEILIESKIIAVADVVVSMTSDRPHRRAFSLNYALNKIKKYSNEKFNQKVVAACLNIFEENTLQLKK